MNREQLEASLSAWLDEPGRANLRAELDRLIRDTPALGALRADWERLTELLRSSGECPRGRVEWNQLRQQILTAVLRQPPQRAGPNGPLTTESGHEQREYPG
jgi:hypothetical protein